MSFMAITYKISMAPMATAAPNFTEVQSVCGNQTSQAVRKLAMRLQESETECEQLILIVLDDNTAL